MKFFFIDKILKWLGKRLDGKKTVAGAAGKIITGLVLILTGVSGLISVAFPDAGLPAMETEAAFGTIGAGCYAISSGVQGLGVGHKLEKNAAAIKEKEKAC